MTIRSIVSVSFVLLLAGSAAQAELIPKQLAGPIDEIRDGVMAPVDPVDTGIHSKSAMIPVDLVETESGEWRWQGTVAVDDARVDMVLFAGDETWTLEVERPGTKSAAAHRVATEWERTSLTFGGAAFEGDHYRFAEAQPGEWKVSVAADAPVGRRGFLLYSSHSAYRLLAYPAGDAQLVGNDIGFVTFGYEKVLGDERRTKAARDLVREAFLRVTSPEGVEALYPMFDDGEHGDGTAGDGVFGGSFPAELAGDYQAQVVARGTTPEGRPFVRTAQHVVPVIEPRVELREDFAAARVVDGQRLRIVLPVDNGVDAPTKYRVLAEVWGADALGDMQPVSWIGGMVPVENGALELGLDLRWIGRSAARSGFELRNVRIEDPDTFIPVTRTARVAIATPKLPAIAEVAPKALDEAMFMGPRPERPQTKAGSRLLLVHGYCSGNVWGPVAGQFSNESIFLDTNQNRSHDAFANLIGSFGSSYSSYGIVAHSQGGAAALHLYTYYWSGLDYASGGRLIQSVGTPYQGTALAGNAAVLGEVFGVGCGTNYDLTYSGASSWLSGVPSWARNAVNYYTTSFTDRWWAYDYCHIVTDVLLSDPDDGTTEKAKGQLSNGVNRGHKTGWCHTDGMRDPNQTRDSSRNSSMNSNAAN